MIVLHASVPIDPDRREEALEQIEELVEKSQAEDGMIEYRATTDLTDPNVVRFFEQYEDETALEAHNRTDHFQAFEEALPEFLNGEPEVLRFDVDSATELEL
jgi:quinol monooxygenase YgiN